MCCNVIFTKTAFLKVVKKNFLVPISLFGIIALVQLSSCRQVDVYEKNKVIPKMEWHQSFAAEGSFDITDTLATYSLGVVLRHTDAYDYNNIWLNVGLQAPGDTMMYQKIDLRLGSDAQGWEGAGMNDIWEVRKPLNAAPRRFIKAGTYQFKIFQVMRDEPLRNVMSAGLRVEKAG